MIDMSRVTSSRDGFLPLAMKVKCENNQQWQPSSSNDLVGRMGYTSTARLIDQIGCGQDGQLTNSSTLIDAPLKHGAPGNILHFLLNIILLLGGKKGFRQQGNRTTPYAAVMDIIMLGVRWYSHIDVSNDAFGNILSINLSSFESFSMLQILVYK